ncbi:unnamed protein product [Effrenium voratum]|uniref:ATP-dependent RNA helicase n=1 Tax=Effrenium voratum TaxID=2562239 RepID=A0AA36MKL6_9DINO|nr:unnamed protein product [Effrenium voratum]
MPLSRHAIPSWHAGITSTNEEDIHQELASKLLAAVDSLEIGFPAARSMPSSSATGGGGDGRSLRRALQEPPHAAVLVAPPGAGKTTAVPLAVLEDVEGGVLVTEPRRVAARAAASRMSALRGEQVGGTIGFRTRFESAVSNKTRVEVVTDGILARRLQAEPTLPQISAVLLDEFHERSLGNDLALALCLHSRQARQAAGLPALRILAMSATLSQRLANRLAELLGGAIVRSEGRQFHVKLRHTKKSRRLLRVANGFEKKAEMAQIVTDAACEALQWQPPDGQPGDVLCFLPGEPEKIQRCMRQLKARLAKQPTKAKPKAAPRRGFGEDATSAAVSLQRTPVDVLPLHGALDAEAQDVAVRPGEPGRRRVILATNVAEASITVEGVTAVVDAGLRKRSVFDPGSGLNRLRLVPISAASADQRMGRAGRLRDGLCLRLWASDERLQPEDVPAIQEEDLASAVLSLASCGVRPSSISSLQWLDPPPSSSVQEASEVLRSLGAFESDSEELSRHGGAMARLPLHPRLAHMALRAVKAPQADAGGFGIAQLCALLEEDQDVVQVKRSCADVTARLLALQGRADPRYPDAEGVPKVCARVLRAAKRLQGDLPPEVRRVRFERCGWLLALAYPERVARRGKKGRFFLRDGSTCVVKDPILREEEFLAVGRLFKTVVTLASPLSTAEAAACLASSGDDGADSG